MADDKKNKWVLFLIGCFSMTQIRVIGFIGISELFLFFLAPLYCVHDWDLLKKHGFSTIIVLSLCCFAGGIVSNLVNNVSFYDGSRGVASPYAIFALIVCMHHFLHLNIFNMKWLIVGFAISAVISTFILQPGSGRNMAADGSIFGGVEHIESVMGYPLFWVSQFDHWLNMPIRIAYLQVPSVYTIAVAVFLPIYSLIWAGGRSAFLTIAFSYAIIFIGMKNRNRMHAIRRYFWLMAILGILLGLLLKGIYIYAVTHELMSEGQQKKFERQSQAGTGVMRLLIGGRVDFFAGLTAALEKPLLGHGSWARDTGGYYERFLFKYGMETDYERYRTKIDKGIIGYLPGHSNVITAWNWYGIFGLIFWLYVFYLYVLTLKKNMATIPQWFGYFALVLPGAIWNFFFSPFGNRVSSCLIMVLCLFVKAVSEGRMIIQLPDQKNAFRRTRNLRSEHLSRGLLQGW